MGMETSHWARRILRLADASLNHKGQNRTRGFQDCWLAPITLELIMPDKITRRRDVTGIWRA